MNRICIRIRRGRTDEETCLNREEVLHFLRKGHAVIDPVGNPVTVWASVPCLSADHVRRYLSKWVEDVIEARG